MGIEHTLVDAYRKGVLCAEVEAAERLARIGERLLGKSELSDAEGWSCWANRDRELRECREFYTSSSVMGRIGYLTGLYLRRIGLNAELDYFYPEQQ